MNWIKAVPFVGTTISLGQCIAATVTGDFKEAGGRLVETCFDAAMDFTVVASGGLASIITAPGKMAAKQAGKVVATTAVKAVAGRALTGVVADKIVGGKGSRHYRSYHYLNSSDEYNSNNGAGGDRDCDNEQDSEEEGEEEEEESSEEESEEEEESSEEDDDTEQETIAEIFGNRKAELFPANRFGHDQEQYRRNNNYRHLDDEESSSEINSYQLNDNCYYTTLAGILNTSVRRLIDRTGILQNRGGAQIPEILDLYEHTGLPIHDILQFDNLHELYAFLTNQPDIGETPVVFPFGYTLPEQQMNHMVALYVRRNPSTRRIEARIVDYQLSKRDPRRHSIPDDQLASPYFLFDIRRRH